MNEQHHFSPDEKTEMGLEAKEAGTAQEIRDYFAFADPILKVNWGEAEPPDEYTPEYIAAHPDITRIFVVRDANGDVVGGAKVKKLGEEDKHRLGLNKNQLMHKDGVLLEYSAVREDHRKRGLFSILTQKRIDWAGQHDAKYVCSEIEITRPISVYTKIRDGFTLVGIKEPGAGILEPYFVAFKQIGENEPATEKNKDEKVQPEYMEMEINENSYQELKRLFSEGWVGVDAKFEGESIPWILILEKNQ
ncbi:MAG: GNAT family N-acetyltransferase [Candidatus Sungbacteria bacterium]|nr:GNAT family N-acetyltransferase [Candidatus Sungbacteria bacterium]